MQREHRRESRNRVPPYVRLVLSAHLAKRLDARVRRRKRVKQRTRQTAISCGQRQRQHRKRVQHRIARRTARCTRSHNAAPPTQRRLGRPVAALDDGALACAAPHAAAAARATYGLKPGPEDCVVSAAAAAADAAKLQDLQDAAEGLVGVLRVAGGPVFAGDGFCGGARVEGAGGAAAGRVEGCEEGRGAAAGVGLDRGEGGEGR